ncbi:helix-turn-helix transcriptional regulator [Bacillus sp. S35]|uniref:helix-turn-helix domain-containing protein n=1 Tax=Priestia aryabhattai TaxID=412384 RepID=UPI00190B09EF|nr:helix-turn-helix transcriptional regulator [Priestia aryabhattai]MBK0009719.1 helix-turn-helix transcriptional regulator [Bacillus sp. S35]MCM3644472.1 helix-turn-helix transcriptional regulator [Priestia aryabhattai]
MIRFKLSNVLEVHDITRNALAREAKVRPNAVYEMCDNQTKRVDLQTLDKLIVTLNELTEKEINLNDILEYIPNSKNAEKTKN